MLRAFIGNPIRTVVVTSTGSNNPVGIPDEPRALSAVCQVTGAPIQYGTDGTDPALTGPQVQGIGAILTLTGQETLRGFRFAATGIVSANLVVTYYD
jgi:hypothetical protein